MKIQVMISKIQMGERATEGREVSPKKNSPLLEEGAGGGDETKYCGIIVQILKSSWIEIICLK